MKLRPGLTGGTPIAKPYENPLLPHARMRELYLALLRDRMLPSSSGQQVVHDCAIALATGLRDVDSCNVCAPDLSLHASVRLALGLTIRQAQRGAPDEKLQEILQAEPLEQVYLAMGAAAGSSRLTLVLLAAEQLASRQWERLFHNAAQLNAPVVLAALPGSRPGLASLADRCGVPGIPVDAADAIALYRVAGECFGRARAGGGPALILAFQLEPSSEAHVLLRRQMIARGAATERWARGQEARLAGLVPELAPEPLRQRRREKVH